MKFKKREQCCKGAISISLIIAGFIAVILLLFLAVNAASRNKKIEHIHVLIEQEQYSRAKEELETLKQSFAVKYLGFSRQKIEENSTIIKTLAFEKLKYSEAMRRFQAKDFSAALNLFLAIEQGSIYYDRAQPKIAEINKILEEKPPVEPQPPVEGTEELAVDIKADNSDGPLVVPSSGSATLSWQSSGAESCAASGGWSGEKPLNGSQVLADITASATYSITCQYKDILASDYVRINLQPKPTLFVSLSATPSSGIIPLNDIELKASVSGTAQGPVTYRFDCENDGKWDFVYENIVETQKSIKGLCKYQNKGTYSVKVQAERDGALPALAVAQIVAAKYPIPKVTLKANDSDGPLAIPYNSSVTLSWVSSNADSCSATGDWVGDKPKTGTQIIEGIVSAKIYKIICKGPGGSGSDSLNINVGASPPQPYSGENGPLSEMAENIETLTDNGGTLGFAPKSSLIAFDRMGEDGYFDVYLMNLDGSNQRCLTCNHLLLPNHHIGNPAWHPSEDFLVIQAVKASVPKIYENNTVPGAGILNDLWIITADGERAWKIYEISSTLSSDSAGVLHPFFSHSGNKFLWSERVGGGKAFGEWVIRMADFVFDPVSGPILGEIKTYNPGNKESFFETHGFSPDDKYILFTGTQDGPLEIYEMELETEIVKRLTTSSFTMWNEHAHYSPDGKHIVWMSSKDLKFNVDPFFLQADFWIMDRDGLNKKRLTYLNDPANPNFRERFIVAADCEWISDQEIVGMVLLNMPDTPKRGVGKIIKITLKPGTY